MDIEINGDRLENLTAVNVILGKNGCGKSTLLKNVESQLVGEAIGRKKYISPERGGVLTYAAGVEESIMSSPAWIADNRRVNQASQFKQQSVAQFRQLEMLILRGSEAAREVADFGVYIDRLNTLLDNIELRRTNPTFKLFSRETGDEVAPNAISSGESEVISLGIEVLMFAQEVEAGKKNLLLLDEPDVHLHPDLQERFISFLHTAVNGNDDLVVIIATHSTPLLSALSGSATASVALMKPGDRHLIFEPVSEVHRRVLPMFGAHPLSNVFNDAPVLLVEGEDDQRIWQQAIRTSAHRLRLYPVVCESVDRMNSYEVETDRIIASVYDNAIAYALRDGDGNTGNLQDIGAVIRLRLQCRAAENLLLSNEVLDSVGMTYDELTASCDTWIGNNPDHPKTGAMVSFRGTGYERRGHDLKELRMILVGVIMNSTKPWEVLVGQALGNFIPPAVGASPDDGSLAQYLGEKVVDSLFRQVVPVVVA